MSYELRFKAKHDRVVLQLYGNGKLQSEFPTIPDLDPNGNDNQAILYNKICKLYLQAVEESREKWENSK